MRTLILSLGFALSLFAAGCGKEASADGAADKPSKATAGQPDKAAADDSKKVDLTPLPLSMRVPKDSMGAMDMTIGDKKSVTVDIGGGTSLNVQELPKEGLDSLAKEFEKDTILHPFKRFAKKDDKGFVVEFSADGKSGFIGVAVQDVGGTKYVCKTTGLDGVKSVEEAEKNLAACAKLEAK